MFVATLEGWTDDYKRVEATNELVGIFTSELGAYRAAWKIELLRNAENYDYGDASPAEEDNEYLDLYKKLDTLKPEELEAMKEKWKKEREEYLGEVGEFTMKSSGHRTVVKEIKEMDVVTLQVDKEWVESVEKTLRKEKKAKREEEE